MPKTAAFYEVTDQLYRDLSKQQFIAVINEENESERSQAEQ